MTQPNSLLSRERLIQGCPYRNTKKTIYRGYLDLNQFESLTDLSGGYNV